MTTHQTHKESNMPERCDVCLGRMVIRLPLHRPLKAVNDGDAVSPDDLHRDYPCPECAPTGSKGQVRIVECHVQVDTRFEGEQGYRELVVKEGVRRIAHLIEEGGLMRVQQTRANEQDFTRGYRITVGVVSPNVVANLDAERHAAEDKFADRVAEIAVAEINHWGSFYGHWEIHKRDAVNLIAGALAKAKAERPAAVRRAAGKQAARGR